MNIGLIEKVGGAIVVGVGLAVFGKGIKNDQERIYKGAIIDTVSCIIEEAEKAGGTKTWEDDDGFLTTTYKKKEGSKDE